MKKVFLLLLFGLFLLSTSNKSFAMNQWYQQGFNDGITYKDQACRVTVDNQASLFRQENDNLKREIARLRSALQQAQSGVNDQSSYNNYNVNSVNPATASPTVKARYYDNVDD